MKNISLAIFLLAISINIRASNDPLLNYLSSESSDHRLILNYQELNRLLKLKRPSCFVAKANPNRGLFSALCSFAKKEQCAVDAYHFFSKQNENFVRRPIEIKALEQECGRIKGRLNQWYAIEDKEIQVKVKDLLDATIIGYRKDMAHLYDLKRAYTKDYGITYEDLGV